MSLICWGMGDSGSINHFASNVASTKETGHCARLPTCFRIVVVFAKLPQVNRTVLDRAPLPEKEETLCGMPVRGYSNDDCEDSLPQSCRPRSISGNSLQSRMIALAPHSSTRMRDISSRSSSLSS